MKLKLLSLVFLCVYAFAKAQVGIGTTTPQATLDIPASDAVAPTTEDGILIPRIDNFPTTNPTLAQDGMMVFVTGNGAPTKGFYYWDNTTTNWIAVSGAGGVTLDQAYDFGGAGAGNTITATDGAVIINGEDGLEVTGTIGSGDAIAASGAGSRMIFNPNKGAFRAGNVDGTQWDDANVGTNTIALGVNTTASGNGATAFGFNTTASGFGATVFGANNVASGAASTVFGGSSTASGVSATAFGVAATASGNFSIAFGQSTEASNQGAIAFGLNTTASGARSTAFGDGSIASGSGATAFGGSNTAPSASETTIGILATEYTPISTTDFEANDRLFTIGNGDDPSNRSNALMILKSGLMNINEEYNMPLTDGTSGQVMTTDGAGNVTFQDAGASGGTLDEAYDFGGAGAGNTITATDGAVTINGEDGILVTGTLGSGEIITASGAGTRMFFNPRKAAFRAGSIFSGGNSDAWDDVNVGNSSAAFGRNTNASGTNSVAFGGGNTSSGNGSASFGFANTVSSSGGAVFGAQNTVSGIYATAFGFNNTASGTSSTVFGEQNVASGQYSISFGLQGTASGRYTSTFGIRNNAPSYAETTIGSLATQYTPNAPLGFDLNDRIFTVGNGEIIALTENRSNALTIYKSGLMNINDSYNMPLVDGTANQVMTTDGAGNVTFQDAGASGGTLDEAYDFGGAGAGDTITATDGAVTIDGEDGILVTGTLGSGESIAISGTGTRMFFNPRKAAFRAGRVTGAQWNDVNVGAYSSAFGRNTTASGENAMAFGELTDATGESATAFGNHSTASGFSATAFGNENLASGSVSTAFGSSAEATGQISVAFGSNVTASGSQSVAFGFLNEATGNRSTAFGSGNAAAAYGETSLGLFSTTYTPASTTGFNANDRLLTLGNGSTTVTRSNALTIYKSGLMNINDAYNMPLTDGTANQVMTTDGSGNVTFQDLPAFTNTDNQQIDVLNLNGTNLEISLQDDGIATQTVDLSSLQDGTGTDNQQIDFLNLNGTNLEISLQDDGIATQTLDLSSLQDGTGTDNQQIDFLNLNGSNLEISLQDDGIATQTLDLSSIDTDTDTQNTLDQAYDEGGAGAGRIINVDNGAVQITGNAGGTTATTPAQLILTETQANDFSRLRFTNSVETTNTWTIAARTDNDATLSRMNFNHNGAGDLLQLWGDGFAEINGTLEIDGRLGININNPGQALILPNTTDNTLGGTLAREWTTYSDSRVKSNQEILVNGLSKLLKITPKRYFHHNSSFEISGLELSQKGENTVGFIAQELHKVLPEAVKKPTDETKELWSVDYDKIIPVAVKAIQELKAEKDALSEQVKKLEEKVQEYASLEARIEALENMPTHYTKNATNSINKE